MGGYHGGGAVALLPRHLIQVCVVEAGRFELLCGGDSGDGLCDHSALSHLCWLVHGRLTALEFSVSLHESTVRVPRRLPGVLAVRNIEVGSCLAVMG